MRLNSRTIVIPHRREVHRIILVCLVRVRNDEIAGCGCGVDVDWGAEVGGWSLEDEVVVSDAGGLTGSEGETRVAVYDQGEGGLVGLGGRRLCASARAAALRAARPRV